MSASLESLSLELLGLPASSRALLARKLLESLEETAEPNAEQAWNKEIERRIEEIRGGKVELLDAADVFREARARLKG